jgi:putative peptide zinc metalloprotease protein
VLDDGRRVPVLGEVTIGREAGNAIVLEDRSVSRAHARVTVSGGGEARVEDVGSSHGTWLDGRPVSGPVPLREGSVLQVGDARVRVEARRDASGAGRTLVVPVDAAPRAPAVDGGARPALRAGWALKRLEEGEGERRWVLRDLRGGGFTRMGAQDAELLELLDGTRSVTELVGEAEQRLGPAGPGVLARLLADLGDRGLLAGVAGARTADGDAGGTAGTLRRVVGPRERSFGDAGPLFDRLYAGGGWVLFTRPALAGLVLLIVAGLVTFVALVAGRYGTPFVVAERLALGGLVFLVGRFALVCLHEAAHGLAMASFGRRAGRAGIKLFLVLPYGFVDTSEAWFEPRRRRMAVAAAGPACDLALGAAFGLLCLVLAPGTMRDVLFQLAFGAYLGAFFNLNPFLDRDGYQILSDWLREPGLRRRSREQLTRRLSGRPPDPADSPVLARFAIAGVVWSLLAAGFAIWLSTRYYPVLKELAPEEVVVAVLAAFYIALFLPVAFTLGRPLLNRRPRAPRVAV